VKPVHTWVEHHATWHPERTALVTEDHTWSYAQLWACVRRGAGILDRLRIGRGDRLGVLAMNLPEFLELLLAASWLGATVVPLNYRLSAPEIGYQLQDSGCRVLFVGREQLDHVPVLRSQAQLEAVIALDQDVEREDVLAYHRLGEEAPPPGQAELQPPDPLLIIYTSGTTGRPKGAVLSNQNMLANAVNGIVTLGLTWQDRFLTLLPLIHIGGIGLFTLPALLLGATVIMPRRFEPRTALQLAARERATVIMVVPTVLRFLTEEPAWAEADLSSVRYFINGGDRCPLELVDRVRAKGVAMGGGYGLTESSPIAYLMTPDDFASGTRGLGFIGKPAVLTEARIVDEAGSDCGPGEVGEIWLRGPNIFQGYWNLPRETHESFTEGWFRTGDLARREPDGHTFIVGRKKEMLKSGGENIYPAEVEAVLAQHPAVAEACVIGRPDEVWGEVPRAVVVLHPGAETTAEELRTFAAQHLARFKVPKEWIFADSLPRTSIGKIARGEVKDRYGR